MKRVFTLTFLLISWLIKGQDCQSSLFYESNPPACTDYLEGLQCIELDITDSYDFEGKELIFIWEMGDGQQKEGLQVTHCYDRGGAYQASLTLVDPLTKVEIKDELIVDVFIKGPSKLRVDSIAPLTRDEPFTPTLTLDLPDNYTVNHYYWSLGDGRYECGQAPALTYDRDGTFQLLLNAEIVYQLDTFYLCHDREVNVGSADPSGGMLDSLFQKLTVETRFLNSPNAYQLLLKSEDEYVKANSGDLKPNLPYILTAYRGNQFFVSDELSAPDVDELQSQISQAAKDLALSKPQVIESIIFELNESEISKRNKKELDKTIEKLKNAPFFEIMVGSFTHTGGSFERNKKLSVERSKLLADYLIEAGLDPSRVNLADPSNQRTLINTCLTGSACNYEDQSLNRRSDFKIIGLKTIAGYE